MWSFQGWAFVGWKSVKQASFLKGFIEATPKGKFVVIDMSVHGEGEWQKVCTTYSTITTRCIVYREHLKEYDYNTPVFLTVGGNSLSYEDSFYIHTV
jgi:hypothetical protein